MMKDTYPCDETKIPLTVNGVPIEYALRENGKPFYPKEVAAANKKALEDKIDTFAWNKTIQEHFFKQEEEVDVSFKQTDKELIKELVDVLNDIVCAYECYQIIDYDDLVLATSLVKKAKGVIND